MVVLVDSAGQGGWPSTELASVPAARIFWQGHHAMPRGVRGLTSTLAVDALPLSLSVALSLMSEIAPALFLHARTR